MLQRRYMTTGINKINVVLDTNILLSSIGFGGKPREIVNLVFEKKIYAVSSPALLAEFQDIIYKKFPLLIPLFEKIQKQIKKIFIIVQPKISLTIVRDQADNKVIEAAMEGNCQYIITGDKDLLDLASYKQIKIVTADQFLELYGKN